VDDVLKYEGEKKYIKIFIYNGGIGIEEQLQQGIDEMTEVL
jgi:hypothetical protein